MLSVLIFLSLPLWASCGDPSDGWLSYAEFSADSTITFFNASWEVPEDPLQEGGESSFWVRRHFRHFSFYHTQTTDTSPSTHQIGLQTAKGDGALIQPVLAWGQMVRP